VNREELERLVEERARAIVREEKEREQARVVEERRRAEADAAAAAAQKAEEEREKEIEVRTRNLAAARAYTPTLAARKPARTVSRKPLIGATVGLVLILPFFVPVAIEVGSWLTPSAAWAPGVPLILLVVLGTLTAVHRGEIRKERHRIADHLARHLAELDKQERRLSELLATTKPQRSAYR
jgi:hypothetical protein